MAYKIEGVWGTFADTLQSALDISRRQAERYSLPFVPVTKPGRGTMFAVRRDGSTGMPKTYNYRIGTHKGVAYMMDEQVLLISKKGDGPYPDAKDLAAALQLGEVNTHLGKLSIWRAR
jgi:hypothetical protein